MRAGAGGYSDAWDGMHCNEQAYDGSGGFAGCRRGWSGKFDLCVVQIDIAIQIFPNVAPALAHNFCNFAQTAESRGFRHPSIACQYAPFFHDIYTDAAT